MGIIADKAPDVAGKGLCVTIAIILACAAALYFGGKDD